MKEHYGIRAASEATIVMSVMRERDMTRTREPRDAQWVTSEQSVLFEITLSGTTRTCEP